MQIENLGPEDFGKGTRKRLPICFCLDVSGSMYGTRMDKLNEAINGFVQTMRDNSSTASSADIAVITFGGYAEILKPFSQLSQQNIPRIEARRRSLTPMGEGINVALDLLEMRKKGYKDRGIRYFQPWIVIITDGKPEGKDADIAIRQATQRLNALELDNKLVVFNIGIDDDVDYGTLSSLSTKRPGPIKIGTENLDKLFEFLGSSSQQVISGKSADLLADTADIIGEKPVNISSVPEIDLDKWLLK